MTATIAGPDPSPRTPKLAVPPGACDSHCHIFGPAGRFPYAEERNYTPPDAGFELYRDLLATLGLERAVIVQPSVYGSDNTCTEDAIRRLEGRGRGVAVIELDIPEAELARLDAAGFRGARINLNHPGGSTPLEALEALAARIAPFGWHLQIYLRGRLLPEVAQRLRGLPVEVVIDHLGHMEPDQGIDQPGMQALLRLLETGRFWVKLCPYRFDLGGFPYARAKPFVAALAAANPERLVWGTDWPHPDIQGERPGEPGPMPNDGDLMDALGAWFEDAGRVRRVLVDNPAKLYGFEGVS